MSHIAFPYAIDRHGRTAGRTEGAHIRDLIEQIVFTMPGERVNRPEFGTPIMQLPFEPNSDAQASAVHTMVEAALQRHLGSRIQVLTVEVTNDEATLHIIISYMLRRTGEQGIAQLTRQI